VSKKKKIWVVTSKGNIGSSTMDLDCPGGTLLDSITQLNEEIVNAGGGDSLRHLVLSSEAWGKLINDPEVIERCNKSAKPRPIAPATNLPERFNPSFSVALSALPWLTFHVID
jgi:hypothetical protein